MQNRNNSLNLVLTSIDDDVNDYFKNDDTVLLNMNPINRRPLRHFENFVSSPLRGAGGGSMAANSRY